uniref:Uncharacterized protein n=1 Tax=Anguilla anguilla TaxID=7936 RepID=A0A0E9RIC1_ANGAN
MEYMHFKKRGWSL